LAEEAAKDTIREQTRLIKVATSARDNAVKDKIAAETKRDEAELDAKKAAADEETALKAAKDAKTALETKAEEALKAE